MNHKLVEEYILSMPNAKLEYPFGEDVAVYRVFVPSSGAVVSDTDGVQGDNEKRARRTNSTVSESRKRETQQSAVSAGSVRSSATEQGSTVSGEWKMFALIPENKEPVNISLKCDPKLSEVLREKYEEVMPGYHLNKKHWITIVISGQLDWEEVQALIRHSYDLVVKGGADTPKF